MNYQLIRDAPKIELILDLILQDSGNFRHTRIDKYSIQFYYQLDDNKTIMFKVYNPSQYGLNELQNEKGN